MTAFSDPPLTAATLAARLARSDFWSAHQLHPLVAKDAIIAAKRLARSSVRGSVPHSMQGILPSSNDPSLLNRLYAHPPIIKLAPKLAAEIFVLEPRPPIRTAITLLKNIDSVNWYYMVLRTELLRENFPAAFSVLHQLKPISYTRVFAPLVACSSIGSLCAWIWSPAPPIAAILAVFWMVIGWPWHPRFPQVMWHKAAHGWLYRLRHTPQLQMANQIMHYYEDIKGVTVDNFHVRASRRQDPAVERELHAALTQLGMEMRPSRSTELYADYWSEQGYNYGSLEWREPDQDPADLLHDAVVHQPPRNTPP